MKFIIYVMLVLLLVVTLITVHEVTHAQILKYWGIDDYEFKFGWTAITMEYYDNENKCNDSCELAHSINEIVGYNIMPFLLIIIMILILKGDKK